MFSTSTFVMPGYMCISICKRKLSRDSLGTVILNYISTTSVMAGINLVCCTLVNQKAFTDSFSLADSEFTYTVVGGFTVAWIAAWELVKQFRKLFATKCMEPSKQDH